MITQIDIDGFVGDDEEILSEFYVSDQNAFDHMEYTLSMEGPFAELFEEELFDFFQFAYHFWGEYIGMDGVDWVSMFYVWMGDE